MSRFMRKGTTRVYFVSTIASLSAPQDTEITAGDELTDSISEMNGFTFSNTPIQTPDLSSAFVSQIPGEDSTEDSSMVLYEDNASNPLLATLAKGTDGYIVILPRGSAGANPAAGDEVDIWPVTVSSNAKRYTVGNEAATIEVKFATTQPPAVEVSLV